MKRIINIVDGMLSSRLALMLVLAVGCFANALADNVISIEKFTIQPGQVKQIAVNLDNTDKIGTVSFNMTLPPELEYVTANFNEARASETHFRLLPTTNETNNSVYFKLMTKDLTWISGNSGAAFYITLKMRDGVLLEKTEDIEITDINLGTLEPIGDIFPEDFNVKVQPVVGTITTSEESFVLAANGSHKVDVILNNDITLYGFEANIILPEGMTFDPENLSAFVKGSRTGTADINPNIEDNGRRAIVNVIDFSGNAIARPADTDKVILSFNVKGSETLAETSEIRIEKVNVADGAFPSNSYDVDPITVSVTSSYYGYTDAVAVVDALQKALDDAVAALDETAPDVKDTEAVTTAKDAIQAQITELKNAVEAAYADNTLLDKQNEILAPKTDIENAITKFTEDAVAAQAAHDKKSENDRNYTRLNTEIQAVQDALNAAKSTIEVDYASVKDRFTETITGIQTQIDDLKAVVDEANTNEELTDEYSIEEKTTEINGLIETLLADAKAAFDKKTANDAAYTALTDEIKADKADWETTKGSIQTEYADVAEQFTEKIAAVDEMFTNLNDSIDDLNSKEELTSESTLEPGKTNISNAITALLDEVKAAQAEFDKKEANEAAYVRLTEEIKTLQTALDAAKQDFTDNYAAVADRFTEDIAAVQTQIDELTKNVKAQYDNVELTAESTIETEKAAINAAIETLRGKVQAEAAKVKANDDAYTKLTGEIATVQTTLANAETTINEDYKDVANQMVEAIAAVKEDIQNLTDSIADLHANEALTAESEIDDEIALINAAITQLLADAADKKAEFDKMSENDKAYTTLTGEIAVVEQKLADAKATIEKDYADVAEQFADSYEPIQAELDALTDSITDLRDKVELTADSEIDDELAAIEAEISALLDAAKAANDKKQANDTAYETLTGEIAGIQTGLDAAVATIEDKYADVADDMADDIAAVQALIDELTADVEAKNAAGELDENYALDAEKTAAIDAAIEQLLKDAEKAQADYEKNKANDDAYDRLTDQLDEVQSQLDAAENVIATKYADVADQFADDIAAIQAEIDALADRLETMHDAVELDENSSIDTATLLMEITTLLNDAAIAHDKATGIDQIKAIIGDDANAKIYTVSGKCVQEPVRGEINIVKYSDGTVKKFYIR